MSDLPAATSYAILDLPLIGLIYPETIAILVLFFAMISGIFIKGIFDRNKPANPERLFKQVFRPLILSPILFIVFLITILLQGNGVPLCVTYFVLAFSIGFSWKPILGK